MSAVLWDAAGYDAKLLRQAIAPLEMIADAFSTRCLAIDDEAAGDDERRRALWLLAMQEPSFAAWRCLADAVDGLRAILDELDQFIASQPAGSPHRPDRSVQPMLAELDAAIGGYFQLVITGRATMALPLAKLVSVAQAVAVGTAVPRGLTVVTA